MQGLTLSKGYLACNVFGQGIEVRRPFGNSRVCGQAFPKETQDRNEHGVTQSPVLRIAERNLSMAPNKNNNQRAIINVQLLGI